jgi:hypothetical protein
LPNIESAINQRRQFRARLTLFGDRTSRKTKLPQILQNQNQLLQQRATILVLLYPPAHPLHCARKRLAKLDRKFSL